MGCFSYKVDYRYRRLIMTPESVRVLISFSCLDILSVIIRFLLTEDWYWEGVCEWSAALWCCKNCLRELLADDSTHLADGLHTADQILLHRHIHIPPKIRFELGPGLRIVSSPLVLQKLFAGITRR